MHSQSLLTARMGVVTEAKEPPTDIRREMSQAPEWTQVSLPGSVLDHLRQSGAVPDPLKDFHSRQLEWVPKSRFLYLIPFKARKKTKTLQNAFLLLDGIDTPARIYLNGRKLMRPANAFCRWSMDITAALRWDAENLLLIILDPLDEPLGESGRELVPDPHGHPERFHVRRDQMSFGGYHCPTLVAPAIRSIPLIDYRASAWIDDFWIHTVYARPEAAYAEIKWRVRSTSTKHPAPLRLTFQVENDGDIEKRVVPVGKFKISTDPMSTGCYECWGTETVTWANPKLWYPHTHGEPHLQNVTASLRSGGVLWDKRVERHGLRVVEIVRKPAPYGRETMRFVVNGVALSIRGANWVPPGGAGVDVGGEHTAILLRKAKSMRMNMLRVWAGGRYESEAFYRLCDEMGILVWQDFPFLDGSYPFGDKRFLSNVRYEVVDNIRRLRRHPSLAALCANSGVKRLTRDSAAGGQTAGPTVDEAFYAKTLARLCDDEIPHTPYLEGTPLGGDNANDPLKGDHHAVEWWLDGKPFDTITKPIPSFLTAVGPPSAPDPRTLAEFVSSKYHHLDSGIVEHSAGKDHQRMQERFQSAGGMDWDTYLAKGWELQSRTLGHVIERLRVEPEQCGGVLVWSLNDAFPGFSPSTLDWRLRPKPAAFRVQQAYADILARFVEEDRPVELRVLNDRPDPLSATLRITFLSLEGETVYDKEMPVEVQPRAVAVPWREALEVHTHLPRHTFLVSARLEHADGVLRATHYPVPIEKFVLPRAEVVVNVRPGKNETLIQLRSSRFVRWVLLEADSPGNGSGLIGFDLIPGEPVVCAFSSKARTAKLRSLSPGLPPWELPLDEKQTFTWGG